MKKIFFLLLMLFLALPVIVNSGVERDATVDLWPEILQRLESGSHAELTHLLETNKNALAQPDDSTLLSIIYSIFLSPKPCDIESIRVLERYGISLRKTDIGNPFHFLGIIEDTDDMATCMDALAAAGFDINAKDSDGKTAIIQNLYHQHPDTLMLLSEMIRKGADPTIRSHKGLDLLHHALLLQLVHTELIPAESAEQDIDSFYLWAKEYIDILKQVNFLYADYYQNQ